MNAGWSENDLRREGLAEESEQRRMPAPTNSPQTSRAPDNLPPIELFPTPREETRATGPGIGEDDDEEINRAILMSLQERQPSYANTDRPEPAEELVQLLIGMGFARARSVSLFFDSLN